ncbi:hypothetical protein [Spiroplasma endosymbiont of Amphibalanus improvisus]|uniref:hypothetical protein n=1 Tax=Spiroplasma endosymbiont of Amphibalanus improvisus TaxID=3066327 RepID=UPI00313F30E0
MSSNNVKEINNPIVVLPEQAIINKTTKLATIIKTDDNNEQDQIKTKVNKKLFLSIFCIVLIISSLIVSGCFYLFRNTNNLNNINSADFKKAMSQSTFNAMDSEADNLELIESSVNSGLCSEFEDNSIKQTVDYKLFINDFEINETVIQSLNSQDDTLSDSFDDSMTYLKNGDNIIRIEGISSKVIGEIDDCVITLTPQFVLDSLHYQDASNMVNYEPDRDSLVFAYHYIDGGICDIYKSFTEEFRDYLQGEVSLYATQANSNGGNVDDSVLTDEIMSDISYYDSNGNKFDPSSSNANDNPFVYNENENSPYYQNIEANINSNGWDGDFVGDLNINIEIAPQVDLSALQDNQSSFFKTIYLNKEQTRSGFQDMVESLNNQFMDDLSDDIDATMNYGPLSSSFNFSTSDLIFKKPKDGNLFTPSDNQNDINASNYYNNGILNFSLHPKSLFDNSDSEHVSSDNEYVPTDISLFYNDLNVTDYQLFYIHPQFDLSLCDTSYVASINYAVPDRSDFDSEKKLIDQIQEDIWSSILNSATLDVAQKISTPNGMDDHIILNFLNKLTKDKICIDTSSIYNTQTSPNPVIEPGTYSVPVTVKPSSIGSKDISSFKGEQTFTVNILDSTVDLNQIDAEWIQEYSGDPSRDTNGYSTDNWTEEILNNVVEYVNHELSNSNISDVDDFNNDDLYAKYLYQYDDYFTINVYIHSDAEWAYGDKHFTIQVHGQNNDKHYDGTTINMK